MKRNPADTKGERNDEAVGFTASARRLLGWVVRYGLPLGIVVALYRYVEMRLQGSARVECVTSSWCLEAPADLWGLAILDALTVMLVCTTIAVAYLITGYLARTGRLFVVAGIMLLVLSVLGGAMFIIHVPAEEKLAMIHIPFITTMLAAVGATLLVNALRERSK